jgi:hypothetical protein
MSERTYVDFSPEAPLVPFATPYASPSESKYEHEMARTYAGTIGKKIEAVAASVISKQPKLTKQSREVSESELNTLTTELSARVRSTKPIEGKTLAHSAILPHYIDVLSRRPNALQRLAELVDEIHEIPFFTEELAKITKHDLTSEEWTDSKVKARYFMDGLIIAAKLTLTGIGYDLGIFGKFIPDVHLREPDNGNSPIAQFDGIFLPPKTRVPKLENTLDKERFIKSLGGKQGLAEGFFDPCILRVPAVLEIKTLFRPRHLINHLSSRIPPYQFRETLQKLGLSLAYSGIAVAPERVVFLRLRSLGPNLINIAYLNTAFYEGWLNDIAKRYETAIAPGFGYDETRFTFLSNFMAYLGINLEWLRKRDYGRECARALERENNSESDFKMAEQVGLDKFALKTPGRIAPSVQLPEGEPKRVHRKKKNKDGSQQSLGMIE